MLGGRQAVVSSLGHILLQSVIGKTYMVLHHIWAGEAISVLEKRC